MVMLSVLRINLKNNGCMHVKFKFVVIVMWNNSAEIKFHFYHICLQALAPSRGPQKLKPNIFIYKHSWGHELKLQIHEI
jgi:hypothetical protein